MSSISGITVTVVVDVWILPCDSVTGTLWTLCTPDSNLNFEYAFSPFIEKTICENPPALALFVDRIFNLNPSSSANLLYILNRSPANILASSPPAAPRISTMIFLSSFSSCGKIKILSFSSNSSNLREFSSIIILANSTSSSLFDSSINLACSTSFKRFSYVINFSEISLILAISLFIAEYSFMLLITAGSSTFFNNSK
ncbi:Hypothetical protein BC94_0740 [Mycoplasmopsis bovis]|uniref:Uncharacterized protein n=1 Tax=Mycoplasmopsis bovis TaxID=28903 RepID=A0A8D4A222_MYCBV|nr:Hypothetical protein BC85_0736 [Mycoplasmopsis bovis]AMW25969.1 Hypothetical protein BC94_0740 [Mycoplasmopsis bovis]AMW26599.1 Hypothetical protein BC93_0736 [Mycoplasmopsis bovis]